MKNHTLVILVLLFQAQYLERAYWRLMLVVDETFVQRSFDMHAKKIYTFLLYLLIRHFYKQTLGKVPFVNLHHL